MKIYQVVIKGCKDDKELNQVLDKLGVLYKCNPEQFRPLLISNNFIAKHSLELETAKKYQKVLEDTGCIAVIESELNFELPSSIQESISGNNLPPINNIPTLQKTNENPSHPNQYIKNKTLTKKTISIANMPSSSKEELIFSEKKTTRNLNIGGVLAIISFIVFVCVIISSESSKKKHSSKTKDEEITKETKPIVRAISNVQPPTFLSDYEYICPAKTPSGAKINLGTTKVYDINVLDKDKICSITQSAGIDAFNVSRTLFEPFCSLANELVSKQWHGSYKDAVTEMKSKMKYGLDKNEKLALYFLEACTSNESKKSYILDIMNSSQYGIYSVGLFTFKGVQCVGYIASQSVIKSTQVFSSGDTAYSLVGIGNCPIKNVPADNQFNPGTNPSGIKLGLIYRETYHYSGDLPLTFNYKGISYAFGGESINGEHSSTFKGANLNKPELLVPPISPFSKASDVYEEQKRSEEAYQNKNGVRINLTINALKVLYGVTAPSEKVKTKDKKLSSIWFEQSFQRGDTNLHVVFIKQQPIDDKGQIDSCHGCAPTIAAVTYKKSKNDEWQLVSKQRDIGELGSWGDAPGITEAQILKLSPDKIAFLIDTGFSNMGFTEFGKALYVFFENNWHNLGWIQTGEGNSGACTDDSSGKSCWDYEGKLSIISNKDNEYPDLLVTKTGKEPDDQGNIIKAKNVIYVFNGHVYKETSNSAIVPERLPYFNAMLDASLKDDEETLMDYKLLLEELPIPPKGDNKSARQLNNQAIAFIRSQHYEKAVPLLEKASQLDPSDIEILNNYGYVLMKTNQLDQAKSVLESVLSIKPDRASAWANFGDIMALKGDNNLAVAAYINTFRFSKDREKTARYFKNQWNSETNQVIRSSISTAMTKLAQLFGHQTLLDNPASLQKPPPPKEQIIKEKKPISGLVNRVVDVDTLIVGGYPIQLAGIETTGQPTMAEQLMAWLETQDLMVECEPIDEKYRCFTKNSDHIDVAKTAIWNGSAKAIKDKSTPETYLKAENIARSQRRGIWNR